MQVVLTRMLFTVFGSSPLS